MSTERGQWSVKDILDVYPYLGLPHFQRGLVWNTDAVSLLLESLYFDTPCGSIVLWKPMSPGREGIALPGADSVEYLLVDGQQRIRSLHDVFHGWDSDTDEDEAEACEDKDGRARVWCLNLARVPELAHHWHGSTLAERPLFMHMVDPRRKRNTERFRYDLVPVNVLLEAGEGGDVFEWDLIRENRDEVLADANSMGLPGKVRSMLEREFFVVIKAESPGTNSLAEMVQLYNRINSGGMRVRAEEKAFATMTTLYPRTREWLTGLFAAVHGYAAIAQDGRLARDELLQRMQERKFGFSLFLRAFAQTASYHFGFSIGSSGLSFTVIHSAAFQEMVFSQDESNVAKLFAESARVVAETAEILRSELHCDAFQFIPETTSLVPVFQMLLVFPNLLRAEPPERRRWKRRLVALLALKLFVSEKNQRELMELARRIGTCNTLDECGKVIHALEVDADRLRERLEYSNSLQDRFVLLLYWLVRRNKARDFQYSQLPASSHIVLSPGHECDINGDCQPEKQHVVPYSLLRDIYSIPGRGRTSSHKANNIGNLTFISHEFNGFERGLGSLPLDLELERLAAPANLHAHLIPQRALAAYGDALEPRNTPAKSSVSFERFCEVRREAIVEGFLEWVAELAEQPGFIEPLDDRTEPAPLLFCRTPESWIRGFDYDNGIEDQLLVLVGRSGVKKLYDQSRIAVYMGKGGRILELVLKENSIDVNLFRPEHPIVARLRSSLPELFTTDGEVSLQPYGDGTAETIDIIGAINAAIAPSDSAQS